MSENKNDIISPENIRKVMLLELAAEIKDRRVNKNITTTEMAKKLGVSISYVTKLERGNILNPHPTLLKGIGDILGVNYLYLYLLIGYIDEDTYKVFQAERGGFCITDVPIIRGLDKENSKKEMGKIRYLSKIEDRKNLTGYLIDKVRILGGKPKYTYAIVNKEEKIDCEKICLFELDGELMLRKYIVVEGKEILIDPENTFNSRFISNKDNIEYLGTLADIIVDLNGVKLKDGIDLPILNPPSLYRRRREP